VEMIRWRRLKFLRLLRVTIRPTRKTIPPKTRKTLACCIDTRSYTLLRRGRHHVDEAHQAARWEWPRQRRRNGLLGEARRAREKLGRAGRRQARRRVRSL